MSKKNVLVVGGGVRVQKYILPALYCLKKQFRLLGIYSKTSKILRSSRTFGEIHILTSLTSIDFRQIDLIIIAVTTENVPHVLYLLSAYETSHIILFIDTPVFEIKHLWAVRYFYRFSQVLVSEDYVSSPMVFACKYLMKKNYINRIKHIYLFHSGYEYHALAFLKSLLSFNYVVSISIKKITLNFREIQILFPSSITSTVLEPRDYSVGRLLVIGEKGFISDYHLNKTYGYYINYIIENGVYHGYYISNSAGEILIQVKSRIKAYKLKNQLLIDYLKIEGLVILFENAFINKGAFKYSYLEGIYDHIAISVTKKFGFFIDYKPPFMHDSLVFLLLKLYGKILTQIHKVSSKNY